MSVSYKELHDRLKKENITDTKINQFAERLLLIYSDIEFVVHVIKGLPDNMKKQIITQVKADAANNKTQAYYKEVLSDYREAGYDNENVIEDANDDEKLLSVEDTIAESVESEQLSQQITESSEEVSCSEMIQVQIAGAVKNPGVYKIDEGKTVGNLIMAAGGFCDNADESLVNFREELYDGMYIKIKEKEIMKVDISGAVNNPGLYSFTEMDLLGNIIEKAGGFTDEADIDAVNLATELNANQKIIIPKKQESISSKVQVDIKETIAEDKKEVKQNSDEIKEEKNKEKADCPTEESSDSKANDFDILLKSENGDYLITSDNTNEIKKETKAHIRILEIFSWIKSVITRSIKRLPMSVQKNLESVEDPIKLQLLAKGYNNGLSKSNFARLLKKQDEMSIDRLKELIEFYIGLVKRAE